MTDLPPNGDTHDQERPDDAGPPPAAPKREASLTLAGGPPREDSTATLMDPANQSLAEALRISFRLVQAAMVVLAFLFVFSGVQQVESNEEGINVLFGKKRASGLEPGFHLAAPYPLGELIKVDTSPEPITVNAFFPRIRDNQTPEAFLTNAMGLQGNPSPPRDGLLITSDLNIVHAWWTANYRRTRPEIALELLHPDHVQGIVRAMMGRAVVQVAAEMDLNGMLRDGVATLERGVELAAQSGLDALGGELGSGIRIDQVRATNRTPPPSLRTRFAAVLNARSQGQTARTNAETTRAETLNAVAGLAASVLIEQIDRYEAAVETGRAEDAERILATIDTILTGEPVEIDGQSYERIVSGEVSETLAQAERTRFSLVNQAASDARLFEAKLDQFGANPRLTMARDWALAMTEFMNKPFVQPMYMPPGQTAAQLIINQDPDYSREMTQERNRREAERALEARERSARQEQFQLRRGIERDEGG